jgi:hypothetical protein
LSVAGQRLRGGSVDLDGWIHEMTLFSLVGAHVGSVVIRPAPDGMAHDANRLARIAQTFIAKTTAPIVRTSHKGEKTIDVRALVAEVDVIADEASERLCAALDWPSSPLLRVRVRSTAEGSAKPAEIARALGVWGSDDPRGTHAQVARLTMVARA